MNCWGIKSSQLKVANFAALKMATEPKLTAADVPGMYLFSLLIIFVSTIHITSISPKYKCGDWGYQFE